MKSFKKESEEELCDIIKEQGGALILNRMDGGL